MMVYDWLPWTTIRQAWNHLVFKLPILKFAIPNCYDFKVHLGILEKPLDLPHCSDLDLLRQEKRLQIQSDFGKLQNELQETEESPGELDPREFTPHGGTYRCRLMIIVEELECFRMDAIDMWVVATLV